MTHPKRPRDLNQLANKVGARTFWRIRFGGPMSVDGWSRTASARLAGIGGMITMIGSIGAGRIAATHRNVTLLRRGEVLAELGHSPFQNGPLTQTAPIRTG
jgi:hypothetical protein